MLPERARSGTGGLDTRPRRPVSAFARGLNALLDTLHGFPIEQCQNSIAALSRPAFRRETGEAGEEHS